ncbi:MAG TPA: ABC transporter ATP-binding protein [Tepidisphaeraceae bacterium]|jgi:NitT/TauT family transport system ATP-binding protein
MRAAIPSVESRAAAAAPLAASRMPPASARSARGHLALKNVTRFFNGSTDHGVQDVTLECAPGEFVVVVGPSGCGKSTLLNLAAGMIQPGSGSLSLDGKPITGPGPDRAMVFQEHGLFPWLTAAQNVEFGLTMAGMSRRDRRDRTDAALKLVHLAGSADKLIHELSGGMRQRVAIARAMVMDPAVLLMDEPFAALDAQTRTLMHAQLQELWGQTRKTILFVTHSVGEAVRLADRIIVLHAHPGRIRRELRVGLPHPRNFDSAAITQLVRLVRKEIEDEVNRVNRSMAAPAEGYWHPAPPAHLDGDSGILGGGI